MYHESGSITLYPGIASSYNRFSVENSLFVLAFTSFLTKLASVTQNVCGKGGPNSTIDVPGVRKDSQVGPTKQRLNCDPNCSFTAPACSPHGDYFSLRERNENPV